MNDRDTHPSAELSPVKQALLEIRELRRRLAARQAQASEPLAIIGMGCRFPGGADSPQAFWSLLREGRQPIVDVPADRWDIDALFDADRDAPGKMYARQGAFLDDVAAFDPYFFGIPPREAHGMDPQQRLLLEVAWETLEDAGVDASHLNGSNTGVFLGIGGFDYAMLETRDVARTAIDAYMGSGVAHSVAAGRLSYFFGFHGPCLSIDTACSSSLVAVHQACASLRSGECRIALAGGANLILVPDLTISFCRARMLSPTNRCRTFDAAADGYVRGEGIALVALKRLSDALADGDRIHAVVRGSAVNQDGRSTGLTVPNGPAQQAVIEQALRTAGLKPSDIQYVETHGTGTPLGDPIEVQALATALGRDRDPQRPILIGSVKTNLGHLESTAGIASLMKVVLALREGEIPAHVGFETPSPHIDWSSLPVAVTAERRTWPESRWIAGVSSFGFSGTNAHVILEAAPEQPRTDAVTNDARPLHLLPLSARSETALRELAARYVRALRDTQSGSLGDICHTAAVGRAHFAHRAAIVASTKDTLIDRLEEVGTSARSPALVVGHARKAPEVAFLFTGQGSQYVGMGKELYGREGVFRQVVDGCAQALSGVLERDLREVMFEESGGLLDQTRYTQPALYALEVGIGRLWQSWGVEPAVVLGHSVGEYAAACVAGVYRLEEGARLIAERGGRMQELPGTGAMLAVMGEAGQLQRRVAEVLQGEAEVSIAARNAPGSVVLSGSRGAIERLEKQLRGGSLLVQPLVVSHGFHSSQMEPMLEGFERYAQEVACEEPRVQWISNLTGEELKWADWSRRMGQYWRRHVREPVEFARGVQAAARAGVEVFVEVGPHPVLTALAKATLSEQKNLLWSGSLQRGMSAWERLLTSVGQLYARGVRIDWRAFDRGRGHRTVTLPTYPFQRQRHWLEDTDVRRRAASPSVHPLLGARMDCAAVAACFERTLTRGDPAFLADHRIGGQVIMPLTAYLEMALAAGRIALRDDELVVRNLLLGAPLILAGEAERLMQVTVDHADGAETNRVRVFSRLVSADGEAWTLHASANVTINSDDYAQDPGPHVEVPDSAREVVDAAMLYSRLRTLGVDFGPSFLGLKTVARTSDGATTGRIETPAVLRSEMSGFCCHPAVLDACLHVAALALDDSARDDERIYLPVAVDRFTLLHSFPPTVLSDARVRETDNGSALVRLDVNIRSEAGELIARLEGVSCRLVNRDVFAGNVASVGDRLMYEIAWRELDMPNAVPSAAPGAWIVLADSQGTCEALTNELAVRGDRVWRVVPGNSFRAVRDGSVQINPQRSEDYARLLSEVAARADLKGIIDLWGLRVPTLSGARAPSDAQTFGAAAALYLMQACARQATKAPLQLFIVTHGSQATRAAERVRPEQAPLWGLGKVALLEHAELRTTLIDLDGSAAPTRDVASMLAVILGATDEPQIAVRDGRCLRPRLVPLLERSADSIPRTAVCRQHAVYLVTGAFGALGTLTARWLFDQGARHLILAGRRPPDAAALTAIRALQAGGAEVSTVETDVATAAGVDGLMAAVAKGDLPLKGIVHCAGVLADGLIAQQSTEQLTTVMRPKADAAWHLHLRTQALDTPLDFFVLFSSFSAIMGAAGQANYVAANSFLDALAADRATQGLAALSVGWGSWEGPGMAARAQVVERFAALGIRPLRADEAFASLAALLHQRVPHAAVAPVDWTLLGTRMQGARGARLLEALLGSVDVRASGITGGPAPQTLSTLARLDRPARIAHVQGILHDAVRTVLGLRRADGVLTDDQTFASLGLDSLTAVELRNALHARLGVRLDQNVGFQYPTLGSLVGHLDQLLQAASVQASNEATSDVGEREEVTL